MRKILIVDDDASIRNIIRYKLGGDGKLCFDQAESGQQALDMVLSAAVVPDLILLDMMMPGMDGIDVFRKISKSRPRIPVIMITAYGSTHLAVEFMKEGGSDFIEKPIDFEILSLKIEKTIDRMRLNERIEAERSEKKVARLIGQMKDEFMAAMNNEIKAPLHGIMSYASLGMTGSGAAGQKEMYFKLIYTCGEKIRGILDEISHFSDLESGSRNCFFREEKIGELAALVIDEIKQKTPAACVTLIRDGDDDTAMVDRRQMMTLIRKLVEFGLSNSPPESCVRVLVRGREKETLEIVVEDEGLGLCADERGELFDRFEPGRGATLNDGNGLGLTLAIIRQIVSAHGGHISAGNKPECGAVFRVAIPRRRPEPEEKT